MEVLIGENIKRLRTERNITQEQLAEVLNVSAVAVSKWERGDTMPDIAMLPRLAYYFQVTIDELMNYDTCAVDLEIKTFITEHTKAAEAYNAKECLRLSKAAYKKFPQDYRVMELYMWDLIGGYADNNPDVILKHKTELEQICDKILKNCQDDFIRRDAYVMQGKISLASGHKEEAIALYREKLPDWYQTAGQKTEQLFEKDTPEFAAYLSKNILELGRFLLNKVSKYIWFDKSLSIHEKANQALLLCEYLKKFPNIVDDSINKELISYFAGDFTAKMKCTKADKDLVGRFQRYVDDNNRL